MPSTQIRVPTHQEFAQMGNDLEGWRAAEALAQRALRGEKIPNKKRNGDEQ